MPWSVQSFRNILNVIRLWLGCRRWYSRHQSEACCQGHWRKYLQCTASQGSRHLAPAMKSDLFINYVDFPVCFYRVYMLFFHVAFNSPLGSLIIRFSCLGWLWWISFSSKIHMPDGHAFLTFVFCVLVSWISLYRWIRSEQSQNPLKLSICQRKLAGELWHHIAVERLKIHLSPIWLLGFPLARSKQELLAEASALLNITRFVYQYLTIHSVEYS